jgi:hypothetical protein
VQRLVDELQFGTSFYQILILELIESYKNADSATSIASRMIAYKSLIYLGDIARYRTQYSSGSKTWLESWIWYEKAYNLNPVGAKPHTQLGIISLYKQIPIDVLYYNCLAIGNVESNSLPSTHLKSFLKDYCDMTIPRSTANFQYMVESAMKLFSNLFINHFHPDLVDFASALKRNLEFMVFQDFLHISKLVLSFIVLYSDFDTLFANATTATNKENYRHCQVVVLSVVLMLSKRCLDILIDQLKESETLIAVECLIPVANLCVWLTSQPGTFTQYFRYTPMLQPTEFENIAIEFARSAADFVNRVDTHVDHTTVLQYSVSDHHLIALKAFGTRFAHALSGTRNVGADPLIVYYSRIATFVKEASENNEIGFISFNKHESRYFVRDSSTKVLFSNSRRRKCIE